MHSLSLLFKLTGCLLTLAIFSFTVSKLPKEDNKPNILLIMSDNQSWNHLGVYGDQVVKTPNIDQLAKGGIRFTNAFCGSPSCTPARAALLTGQEIWRLKEGANLWGTLPLEFKVYPDILEENGYHVGYQGKGWGPGNFQVAGRKRNPAGDLYKSFTSFLESNRKNGNSPWTYWFSSKDPHRPYETGSGKMAGIDPKKVVVPSYLPDTPETRNDIADYYASIQHFDKQVGELVAQLKESGQYHNTVVVVCSDNGWQMPRGLANVYDFGTRVPLIISWPEKIKPNTVSNRMISLNDLAPTFLEIAGIEPPVEMTAKSRLTLLTSEKESKNSLEQEFIVIGRERHAYVRQNGLGYPVRAIRTTRFLYIRNYSPERWPAGDPPLYGDVDAHMLHYSSPTKLYLLKNHEDKSIKPLFNLAFGKRPSEELYDLHKDPDQLASVAQQPAYRLIKKKLSNQMLDYLKQTKDPRVQNANLIWDTSPYYNERDKQPRPGKDAIETLNLQGVYNYLTE